MRQTNTYYAIAQINAKDGETYVQAFLNVNSILWTPHLPNGFHFREHADAVSMSSYINRETKAKSYVVEIIITIVRPDGPITNTNNWKS